MNRLRSLNDLQTLREKLLLEEKRPTIRVCCGTGCCAAGGLETAEAFSKKEREKRYRGGENRLSGMVRKGTAGGH